MADEAKRETPDRRLAIVTFLVALAAATATGFMTGRIHPLGVKQPIAFNHRKHVVENQIGCSTCHQYYETQSFSGLPDASVCSTCHAEPLGKSAEEARLVKLMKDGQPIVWNSLFRQPSHIFYSHRRHVVKARIPCERCHGQIALTSAPPSRVKKLSMTDCIACHEQRGVPVDCTTCHR